MSGWETIHEGEPPLQLTRQVTNFDRLSTVYDEVVAYMVARRDEDEWTAPTQLLIFANATNGYVRFSWYDAEDRAAGKWAYTLQLPRLWRASLTHDDGAFYYDRTCRGAASFFAEESQALPEGVTVMFRTELGGAEALP